MGQIRVHKAKGLKTFRNELTLNEGSLITADNVVIDRDDVIESRRGFSTYSQDFGNSSDRAKQILQYKDTLLLHYDDKLMYDDGSGDLNQFEGVYEEVEDNLRIKGIEANGNFYFTSDDGVKKISATNSTQFTTSAGYIIDSGAPKALDVFSFIDPVSTSGFFETAKTIGYRVVWGYKDVNENLILGAPSAISIVNNTTGGNRTTKLQFTIPSSITNGSDYFYQVYRSAQSSSDLPEDELNLVFEDFPTSTDYTNGYVEVSDVTPEDFRTSGTPLYTNPISGETILQANEQAPLCTDIAEFKNSVFYANTKTRHKKNLNIISVSGLSNGDQITIGFTGGSSTTYTFQASENIGAREVLLSTSGTVAQNIDDTARSLVRVINRDTSSFVYAYYISSVNDVPGQILLEARSLSDTDFYVKVSDVSMSPNFNPQLPTTETELSDNEEFPNRIYYSKTSEPEAVPIVNYFDVGERDSAIKRIIALRDSLFIMKEDGIYRLSGSDTTSFVVSLFDSSSPIAAPDSAAVLNNQIYMLTRQGVVTVTDSGVSIISRDIERKILEPINKNSNFDQYIFGVSYESDRAYIMWMPEIANDTVATQCYRYNVFTRTWVRWDVSATCGLVIEGSDKLYIGAADTNGIEAERKDYDRTDFVDRDYIVDLLDDSVNSTVLNLPAITREEVNDIILQNQYITISRFNRLLSKLDMDVYLDDTDYKSSLTISVGGNLATSLNNLINKINADDASYDYSTTLGLPDGNIEELRDKYNALVSDLNSSTGTFYLNYRQYTDLVFYESYITEINANTNKITLAEEIPLLVGDLVHYKSIRSEVQWSPQTVDTSGMMKQFREATLMFDQMSFSQGSFIFRSDISDDQIFTTFNGEGNGAYGSQIYGEFTYGGGADQRQIRTYVPRNKQRSRFIIMGFLHNIGRENFAITGYSLTYNSDTTERAYRR